jgi:hypothetical protein
MKNKKYLANAIETLTMSWGGDTTPEAYWVLTDLIKYINSEYNQKFAQLKGEALTKENALKLEKILTFLRTTRF